jgi:hypothetical protein
MAGAKANAVAFKASFRTFTKEVQPDKICLKKKEIIAMQGRSLKMIFT